MKIGRQHRGDPERELDKLITGVQAGWTKQHLPDGTHGAITAETLDTSGAATVRGTLVVLDGIFPLGGLTTSGSDIVFLGATGHASGYNLIVSGNALFSAVLRAPALNVDGTQVVGAQEGAIADAAGGATVDAEARTAVNAILAALRTHGLIAT